MKKGREKRRKKEKKKKKEEKKRENSAFLPLAALARRGTDSGQRAVKPRGAAGHGAVGCGRVTPTRFPPARTPPAAGLPGAGREGTDPSGWDAPPAPHPQRAAPGAQALLKLAKSPQIPPCPQNAPGTRGTGGLMSPSQGRPDVWRWVPGGRGVHSSPGFAEPLWGAGWRGEEGSDSQGTPPPAPPALPEVSGEPSSAAALGWNESNRGGAEKNKNEIIIIFAETKTVWQGDWCHSKK